VKPNLRAKILCITEQGTEPKQNQSHEFSGQARNQTTGAHKMCPSQTLNNCLLSHVSMFGP